MADDDEVGYKRPPKRTRFRKGTSGNPRGRPKGARNLKTDLVEELAERITLREGGRTRTVSKRRGVVKRLVNDALGGKVSAAGQLVGLMLRLLDDAPDAELPAAVSADEQAVLAELKRRLMAPAPGAATVGGETVAGAASPEGIELLPNGPASGSGEDDPGPGPGPSPEDPEEGGAP